MNGYNPVMVNFVVCLFGCDLVDAVQNRPVHYAIDSNLGLII
ncbi:MAG TPA: hypothetical protein VGK06_03670 [Methanosarcina sp.]